MKILTLVLTQPKLSYQDGIREFCKEYAIGYDLTDTEIDSFRKDYRMEEIYQYEKPVITMRRRVDFLENGERFEREWDYFDCFPNFEKASNGFGDSDYIRGENFTFSHNLHAKAVRTQRTYEELTEGLNSLSVEYAGLKEKYQGIYEQKLKEKHLWTKAKNGTAPQKIVDEIAEALRREKMAEKERIEALKKEITSKLKKLS